MSTDRLVALISIFRFADNTFHISLSHTTRPGKHAPGSHTIERGVPRDRVVETVERMLDNQPPEG